MSSLLLLFIFVPVLTGILLALNLLLAVHRPDDSKVSAYECGFSPIYGQTRSPFHVQFYIVGILFLIFDLEILLVYPICVTLYQVSTYGFWILIIFFLILTVGFVLEIGSGALYFTDQKTSLADLRPKDDITTPPFSKPLPQWGILGLVLISNMDWVNLNEYLEPISFISLVEDLPTPFSLHLKTPVFLAAPLITSKSYFELINEKDKGQDTDNIYLLAKRHIASGASTDLNIINQCLSAAPQSVYTQTGEDEFSLSITQKELDSLIGIEKIELQLPLDKTSDLVFKALGQNLPESQPNSSSKRLVGVYVLTNKLTGDQYVGSSHLVCVRVNPYTDSVNLEARIKRYFSPSVLANEKRSITKSLVEYGIENFSLQIYKIDPSLFEGDFTLQERALSLALEQYYIFTLNPVLNHIKVAGATPGGPMDENTKLSIKKSNSKPLYIYNHDKTILYYISESSAPILQEFNLCKHTLWRHLASGVALYGKLTISKELLPGVTMKLLDIKELAEILAEGKSTSNLNYKSNQKISITLIDNETNKEYFFASLRSASKFTKSFDLNNSRYIGMDKIVKMKSGESYKGWIVSR